MKPSHSQNRTILRLGGFVIYLAWWSFQTKTCFATFVPSPCPPLLAQTIARVIQASATGRPIYLLVQNHSTRTSTMYFGVDDNAESRALARREHSNWERSQVRRLYRFDRSTALGELGNLICDRFGSLAFRRSALRLWALMRGYEDTDSDVLAMGSSIAHNLLVGTDSSDDRILLHDLWLELRNLTEAPAKRYLAHLLQTLLEWDDEKSHFLAPHTRANRNSLLSTVLADANAEQFELLTAQIGMLPQPTQLQIVLDVAHILDRLLDKPETETKLMVKAMRELKPAVGNAIAWIRNNRWITMQSTDLPKALEWNDDLGMLEGINYLIEKPDSPDSMHPGHLLAFLFQYYPEGPLTPAQRFLIRNYCQAITVARLSSEALAELHEYMKNILERLRKATLALPPFDLETESSSPSEYTDIRVLLQVFPWKLYKKTQKRALLNPFLDEAKYGRELSALAREILARR